MKKIVIFGNSGAGKSTLAKKLQQKFNLTHLDLDLFAWTDDSIATRKVLTESIQEVNKALLSLNSWVVEGCYADLLAHVIKTANEVIFINPGTQACIENCHNRPWESHKYASKEEQDKNLDMLIEWVKLYDSRDDEFSLRAHQALFDSFKGNKVELLKGDQYPL